MPPRMKTTKTDSTEVPVRMTRETQRMLKAFARALGKDPSEVAGVLLHDMLAEDREAHGLSPLLH